MKKSCKFMRVLGVLAAIAAVIGFVFYCLESDSDCPVCKFIRRLFGKDEDDIEFFEEFEADEEAPDENVEETEETEEVAEEPAEKKVKHKSPRGYISLDLGSDQ